VKIEEIKGILPEIEVQRQSVNEGIKELLNERKEEAQLVLNSNSLGRYLTSSSQLDAQAGSEFSLRNMHDDDDGSISFGRGEFYGENSNEGNLEIGKTGRTTRAAVSDDARIDLGAQQPNLEPTGVRVKGKKPEPTLGISGAPERILTFASSTIGTEDYKLWNKINAELDRLNTGRYGSVPKEIVRMRNGFVIKFAYADGTRQEIQWQNSGNVLIKIIGKSRRTPVQELRRALDSLLTITLAN